MENWHKEYNPSAFLRNVKVEELISKNKADIENKADILESPCVLCGSVIGPGLMLNDKSYLCRDCFKEIAETNYPEKYEKQYRKYLAELKAYNLARWEIRSEINKKKEKEGLFYIVAFISLALLSINIWLLIVPIIFILLGVSFHNKYNNMLDLWDKEFTEPPKPKLYHFHHPLAILSERDKKILEVFNNWPGYPPFWDYLRHVVLERDNNHCQVTGCPSRVALHIHHKIPKSDGGKHIPNNLITLCCFHHALEPSAGHNFVWGNLKNQYFTMVREFTRKNRKNPGYHIVRPFVRRHELVTYEDVRKIKDYYKYSCPECGSSEIDYMITDRSVIVECQSCKKGWIGERQLAEEVGPKLAEILKVNNNSGNWKPKWDMLDNRMNSFLISAKENDTGKMLVKPKPADEYNVRKIDKDKPKHNKVSMDIESKSAEAYYNIGCIKYINLSYLDAVKWFRLASEQGHDKSQNYLGLCYDCGKGVVKNYKEAVKWYKLSAEQGYIYAQYNLAIKYYNGQGVVQDYKEAVKWFRLSAKQGDEDAQYNLGLCYYEGKGILQDYKEAVKWYKLAAEQGEAKAQLYLGSFYRKGEGIEQDYEEAYKWDKAAAEQGNAEAQFNLGLSYELGRGTKQDYRKAVKWYKSASKQGHTTAQSILGMCYETGTGLSQNYLKAYKWYYLSCRNEKGVMIEDTMQSRDKVKKYLTKEQIEEATMEAKEIQKRIDEKE